jgi:hypothetical protein
MIGTMRDVIVAANWKMHPTPADAGELARTIAARTRVAGVVRVICPPFVSLASVRDALAEDDPDVAVGAQNVHHELQGAYTGEIAAPMLAGLASWVIVGHSERRRDAGETDALIGRKLGRAIDAGLRPILCVGEQLSDREAGLQDAVVDGQLRGAFGALGEIGGSDTAAIRAAPPGRPRRFRDRPPPRRRRDRRRRHAHLAFVVACMAACHAHGVGGGRRPAARADGQLRGRPPEPGCRPSRAPGPAADRRGHRR